MTVSESSWIRTSVGVVLSQCLYEIGILSLLSDGKAQGVQEIRCFPVVPLLKEHIGTDESGGVALTEGLRPGIVVHCALVRPLFLPNLLWVMLWR